MIDNHNSEWYRSIGHVEREVMNMIANEKVTRRDIPERIRNEILAELRDGELRLVDDRLPGFPELSSFEFPVKSNGAYCTFRFWFPSSFQNYKTLPIEASGFGLYTTVCQKEFYSLETRCILDVGGGVLASPGTCAAATAATIAALNFVAHAIMFGSCAVTAILVVVTRGSAIVKGFEK